jgi:hypothetical protein
MHLKIRASCIALYHIPASPVQQVDFSSQKGRKLALSLRPFMAMSI